MMRISGWPKFHFQHYVTDHQLFDDCQIHADNMRADYIAPVLSGIASLQNYAQQWYLDKGLTWPAQPPVNKIDVHHHMVPDFYAKGACVSYVRRPS